jgi:hypothetical protein
MELSRRRLLALGGGTVAAAALGTHPAGAAPRRTDAVVGGVFDLTVPSTQLLREVTIQNGTVMQSFAFDNTNGYIYTIQVIQGGLQLSGESAPVSGADREAHGDLVVTKLTLGGSNVGHMWLKGFGHGVSIGVEPVGGTAYLWTESDNNPDSGYGRAISRFAFSNGAVLSSTSSSLVKHYPVAGSTANQPAVDILNRRLLLRYRIAGVPRYALYDLDQATAGTFVPIYDVPQVGVADTETFQGFTVLGDYAYQMTGTAYTDESGSNPPSGHGNTYVSSIDLTTGALVQRFRTEAAYSLTYREPEGMAVQLTSPRRLCMGFASGTSGARMASIYYKEQTA